MELTNQLIFLAGVLFLASILASTVTPRLGVPLLLVFLVVGMLAGEDGPGGIPFSNYPLANLAATAALAVVLFDRSGPASSDSFPGFISDALPGYAASCSGSALKYTVSGVWPSSDECGRRVL